MRMGGHSHRTDLDDRRRDAMPSAPAVNRTRLTKLTATVHDIGKESSKAAELARLLECALVTLDAVGDDAQLANADLQNVLQKQQQTLQTMSNISKQLYDTAQSVIRKIGG
jgi:hypothetical protein